MRRLFLSLVVIFCIISLSACAKLNKADHDYTPPQSSAGQYCAHRCEQAFNSCVQICGLKNPRCAEEMRENASQEFEEYKADRKAKGWRIRKTYNSFLRKATCEKPCNCVPAYNTCYRACGGKVY